MYRETIREVNMEYMPKQTTEASASVCQLQATWP